MIEENPILYINVKLLKFWGYILHPSWRTPVGFMAVVWLNVQQFVDLYFTWGDIQTTIMNAYFVVLFFNAVVRSITLMTNRKSVEDFMKRLDECYIDIQNNGSKKAKEILEIRTNRANLITKVNLFMGIFSTLCFFTYPLITSTNEYRTHVYGVWLPLNVDKSNTPYYEIIYVIQMLTTFPSFCMYIPVSNLLATYMIFGIAQLEILQHYLITLKDERDAKQLDKGGCDTDNCIRGSEAEIKSIEGGNYTYINERLKKCIQIHQNINKYVTDMNTLVKYVMFLEFLSFTVMLCALLFLLNIVNQLSQVLMVSCYISMIMVQVFVFYWHANELTLESLSISNAVYFGPWYQYDRESRKSIQILMIRAQRPLQVSVGNIYPMGLEMFQTILNTAYTYFTILRRVYD